MQQQTIRAALAAASAAMLALGFAPAPSTVDMTAALGLTDDAHGHRVLDVEGPTSALDGLRLAPGDDGRIGRDDLLTPLAGLDVDADVRDVDARRAGLRRVLEDGGLTVIAAEDGCEECEGEDSASLDVYAFSFASPVGDVDADGTEDIAVTRGEYDVETDTFTAATEVRTGTDGALLWERPGIDDGYLVAVPDVDGDGRDDLMFISFGVESEFSEECDDDGCSFRDEFSVTHGLDVVRGIDGEPVGGTAITSRFVYEQDFVTTAAGPVEQHSYSGRWSDLDLITELAFVDGNGDGAHQLLAGTVSFEDSWQGERLGTDGVVTYVELDRGSFEMADHSRVAVLDLAAGHERLLQSTEADGRVAFPRVVADDGGDLVAIASYDAYDGQGGYTCADTSVVGDCIGAPSLEPVSTGPPEPPTYALVEPAGDVRWEIPMGEESVALVSALGDVDGDGRTDLVDLTYDEHGDDAIGLVSGADGSTAWTASILYARAAGDHLAGLDVAYYSNGEEEAVVVDAVTLSNDGAELARSELGRPGGTQNENGFTEDYLWVSFLPVVGDGIDVVGLLERYVFVLVDEDCETEIDPDDGQEYEYCYWYYEGYVESSSVTALAGATLAVALARDLAGAWVDDIAPLDDAAGAELLLVTFDDESDAVGLTAEGLDGSVLWAAAETLSSGTVRMADGTADVLAVDLAGGVTSLLDGASGAVRFEVATGIDFGVGGGTARTAS